MEQHGTAVRAGRFGVAVAATVLDLAGALVGGFVTGDGRGVALGWVGASGLQVLLASPLIVGFVHRMRRSLSHGIGVTDAAGPDPAP